MAMRDGNRARIRIKTACLIVAAALVTVGVLAPSARQAAQSPGQVTFTKDIAPILQRSCQNCHRPNGGLAPMTLTTYEEVRPWARAIKLRTAKREMPPWFLEKSVGIQDFKDDISLSDAEIATIGAWVDAGAPRGNPADMPPPRQFADSNAWSIGEPDLIVDSPLITVKAVGGDYHAPIVGATLTGLTENRWIAAFEVKEYRPGESQRSSGRPGLGNNYFVLHHQGITNVPPSEAGAEGGEAGGDGRRPGTLAYTYEVGQNAQFVPEGAGIELESGGSIYFNSTHQHSIGKEVKMHVRIGFKLHPKGYVPKYPNGYLGTGGGAILSPRVGLGAELDIPGNTDNVRFDRFYTLQKNARLVTFEPHMHASGKRMCAEAIYPDGRIETLNCAGYNHAWVKTYIYQDHVAPLLPKGTTLHIIGWYDNTVKNPRVVDPRNWRGTGHRSIDDMIILISQFVAYTDDEFKTEVAARADRNKPPRPVTTTAQK
jgi:mono/diheme cytochrome c family protein